MFRSEISFGFRLYQKLTERDIDRQTERDCRHWGEQEEDELQENVTIGCVL